MWPPSPRSTRRLAALRRAAREALAFALAGGLVGLAAVGLDAAARTRWGAAGPAAHAAGAATLALAAGALAGLVVGLAHALTRAAGRGRGAGPRRRAGAVLALGLAAAIASPLARLSLGGPLRGVAAAPVVAALAALVAVLVAGAALAATDRGLAARQRRRDGRGGLARALPPALVAAALVACDARMLVGRHLAVHLALEAAAFVVLVRLGARAVGGPVARARPALLGGLGLAVAVALGADAERGRVLGALRHLTLEPSPAGTLYTRAARAFAPAAAPSSSANAGLVAAPPSGRPVDAKWTRGEDESDEQGTRAVALRTPCADCNVLVYFVDTLRADVAADANVMPAAVAFSERAVRFRRAYSAASDTLHVLPALLGGRYDGETSGSVLRQAREGRLDNAVFIASSANAFVRAQVPAFDFDESVVVDDHDPADTSIWGYGADTPTGEALASRAVAWMADRRDRRFFAWFYNYDLHGWRHLKDDHVRPAADARDGDGDDARYRAVARLVDRSFEGVLRGLEDLGLADRTVVALVSDHGEALGYRGFLTHSTFLWEPLVRVPLALRVPGVAPREVTQQVSLVDVTPTLARFVDPATDVRAYHGLDLLRYVDEPEATRSLPLLLRATSEGRASLVGVVRDDRKLVLAVESGTHELHRLDRQDPDDEDLTALEPEAAATLLDELTGSPVVDAP